MSPPDELAERFQWFLSGERPAGPAERDARLGAIAIREGYLTSDRVGQCLRARAGRPLLEVAREKGLLTAVQVKAIEDIERIACADTDTSSGPSAAAGDSGAARALLGRSRLGRFRLIELLGEGGMGVVFRARDDELGRDVALKMLKTVQSYSAVQVERFQREARNAARLSHPGIVTIHEVGREEDALYYTMELVAGRPLNEVKADLDARVELLEKVARAVQYAHEQGVIHRDLKPPNILVDDQGAPQILDFGLSRDLQTTTELSRTGALLGTPCYMSPEQAEGRVHEVDARTDVYAMGVMLYESMTGRVPFEGSTMAEVVRRSLEEEPKPPPGPPPLAAICLKAMEKDPARRYPTAGALADDLGRYLKGEPVRARPAGGLRRLLRRASRPAFLAGTGAGVVALGVWLLWGIGRGPAPSPASPPAPPARVVDRWKDALNLLPRIDLAQDAVSGAWKTERGELVSDRGKNARVEIPYLLPQEYDLRVRFTPREKDGKVAVILSRSGRSFAFIADPNDGDLRSSGFVFAGLGGSWQSPPAVHAANAVTPGKRHVLVFEVREGQVSVLLDDRRLGTCPFKEDASRLTGPWSLKDKRVPGLGASEGATVFHGAELLEIRGRGRPSR